MRWCVFSITGITDRSDGTSLFDSHALFYNLRIQVRKVVGVGAFRIKHPHNLSSQCTCTYSLNDTVRGRDYQCTLRSKDVDPLMFSLATITRITVETSN